MKPKAFRPIPSGCARPAVGFMPFAGHRSRDQWLKRRGRPPKTEEEKDADDDNAILKDAAEGSAKLANAILNCAR